MINTSSKWVHEPGVPVAAVERGKQVLVSKDHPFLVGDHDFTKAKLVPSVTLLCNVPDRTLVKCL